jgi:O-antigen/teichoic acid export membrane protein
MSKKVYKNTILYSITDYLPLASSFLLMPLFTRILTPEDYGNTALIQTFSILVTIALGLQLGGAINRFYFDHHHSKEELRKYLGSITIFLTVFSTLVALGFDFMGDSALKIIYPNSTLPWNPYYRITLITIVVTLIGNIFKGIIRTEEKGGLFLKWSFYITAGTIAFNFWQVVILRNGVLGILYANLFSALISLVVFFYLVKSRIQWHYEWKFVKPSMVYGIPLIPHALGGFLFLYSDRVVLEKFVPVATIGLYSIADRLASIVKTLVENMNTSYSPALLKRLKENEEEALSYFAELSVRLTGITLAFSLGIVFFAKEFLIIFTTPKYYGAWIFIPILTLAYIARVFSGFNGMSFIYKKKMASLPIISAIVGATNVGLNFYFLPKYGAVVAAWTTVVAYALQAILMYILAKKIFVIRFQVGKMLWLFGAFGCAYLLHHVLAPAEMQIGILEILLKLLGYLATCVLFYKILDWNPLLGGIEYFQRKWKKV